MKVSAVILAVSNPVGAVIPDFALVKAGSGIKMLRDVAEGEQVLSADQTRKLLMPGLVASNKPRSRRNSTIKVTTAESTIHAAPDQELFDPLRDQWVKAEDLTAENMLLNEEMQHEEITAVERLSHSPMFTRAVSIEATHQLFVDGYLTHNMWMWDGLKAVGQAAREVDWKWVGKEIAKEAVKEAGKAVVKEAVHEVVDYMKQSGVDIDSGYDPRGETWQHHNFENEKMVMDLKTGHWQNPDTKMDIVMTASDWRNMPGNHPASKADHNASWGDGYVKAGDKPVQMEFANGEVSYLSPGDVYAYGFNAPTKINGVEVPKQRAEVAEHVARPAAAPAPSKPKAAPKAPVAEAKPAPVAKKQVEPVKQPAPCPAAASAASKEVKRAPEIFPGAANLPKLPSAANRPIYVEVRALPQNQLSAASGPVMDLSGFLAQRQQIRMQKNSDNKG